MLKREIAEHLAKYTLRSGRGSGLICQVTDIFRDVLEGTVYLFALKGLLGISIPPAFLIVIVVVKKIVEYSLGWLDEKWGYWRVEVDYASRKINPFNAEMMERLKRIESAVVKE